MSRCAWSARLLAIRLSSKYPGAMKTSNGGHASKELHEGLYELLSTEGLIERLNKEVGLRPIFAKLADEDAADSLSRHVSDAVSRALSETPPAGRVALANRLLQQQIGRASCRERVL